MILEVINHSFQYEAEKLIRIFYPNEKISVVYERTQAENEKVFLTEFSDGKLFIRFSDENKNILFYKETDAVGTDNKELLMACVMFDALTAVTGYRPEWGILTGIRPSKLLRSLISQHGSEKGMEIFRNGYFVSEQKSRLALSVAEAEERIISLSRPESFSLYVSIPFCPTRCSYCSFVSHDMTSGTIKKLMPDYLKCLVKELEVTGGMAKELGLRLESVYFGGGTPTTLTAEELRHILSAVENNFDLSAVREYTVEAGRPDTVTKEKLEVLKSGGVSRISINPQTFSDSVLNEIGRRHTSKQTEEAFLLARSLGFDNINMDLIAGLPTDDYNGFCKSLNKALSLSPENITVHTLSLKRSSALGTEDGRVRTERADEVGRMLGFAYEALIAEGFHPYYMYRQSKTLGNFENTGYCKKDFQCLYNIFMMEECHSVLSVGAGAVTKLKSPVTDKIDRIFNYKYPYEYINGFDEILSRKEVIIPFYEDKK